MYVIPNAIREKIYEDGGVEYTPIVTIGEQPISLSNIKSLVVSRPVINKEDKYMHLGSFISDKLTMTLHKPEEIDFSQKVHLSVKMKCIVYFLVMKYNIFGQAFRKRMFDYCIFWMRKRCLKREMKFRLWL